MARDETPATPGDAPATPAPSITPEQIDIVKGMVPTIEKHAVAISTLFYKNMISENPALKNMFSMRTQATGAQALALANAVIKYATYIDQPHLLSHAIERIAHKHASLQVEPAMYDLVGKYLLQAIGIVLGDKAAPAVVDAWTAAYGVLAAAFINREKDLYTESRARTNNKGWVGWRKFRVAHREAANDRANITSFHLEPVDGKCLPAFEPGQYVSLRLFVPELSLFQSRQYSLSQMPIDGGAASYQITVKREDASIHVPRGIISSMVHALEDGDEVKLSQPQGEFVVVENEQMPPLVLLSAGVGATPLQSMLENALSEGRSVSWLHGSPTLVDMPFWNDLKIIQQRNPGQVQTHLWLTEASVSENAEQDSKAITGGSRLHVAKLTPADRARLLLIDNPRAGYYICGPPSFMAESRSALIDMGVDPNRVHVELFSTGDI